MVKLDTIERLQKIADAACSSYGVNGATLIAEQGPKSLLVIIPDCEFVGDIAEAIGGDDVIEDAVFLSEWYEANGEPYTEVETRTLIVDVRKDCCEFTQDEIAAHRKENIIELDPKWRNGSEIVFMPITKKFFNAIAQNKKKFEWRDYCETWVKKIIGAHAKYVKFQCGYTKNAPKMLWEIKEVKLADSDDEGGERYSPYDIPPMAEPQHIVIELGNRVL